VPAPSKPSTLLLFVGSDSGPAQLAVRSGSNVLARDRFAGVPHGSATLVYRVGLRPRAGGGTVTVSWTAGRGAAGVTLQTVALLDR
jgi:hypothetical protein